MFDIGPTELIIILIIIILLFGVGRISQVAGELGEGIRAFREGLQSGQGQENEQIATGEELGTNQDASSPKIE